MRPPVKDSVFLNQRSFFCLLPKILEILSSTVHDINICGESREICALWSSGFQASPFLSKHDCAWAQEDFCTALSVNTVHRLIHKCNFKLFDLNKNKKQKDFCAQAFWICPVTCLLSSVITDVGSSRLNRSGAKQHVINTVFKSQHLWWYEEN